MKVRPLSFIALTILLLAIANSSNAAEPAGAEDAKGLLAQAVSYMEKEGTAKAFCAFNDPTGAFHKGPLYLFVINMDGVYFAHSAAPTLIGTSLRDLKDASGQLFGKKIMGSSPLGGREAWTTSGSTTLRVRWRTSIPL